MIGERVLGWIPGAAAGAPWPGGAGAALAVALAAAALLSTGLVQVLALSAAYPVKVLLALTAGAFLARPWLRAEGPGFRFGAANRVTLARAVLAALVLALVGESDSAAATAALVAAVAAALDGVDGHVARRTGTASAFGARFDMETDALLVLALSLLAWQWDRAGAWVLAAGLARYAFVAAGVLAPWLRRPLPPSGRRRAVCALLTVALVACISPPVPAPASALAGAVGLAALALSFTLDILWLARARRANARSELP